MSGQLSCLLQNVTRYNGIREVQGMLWASSTWIWAVAEEQSDDGEHRMGWATFVRSRPPYSKPGLTTAPSPAEFYQLFVKPLLPLFRITSIKLVPPPSIGKILQSKTLKARASQLRTQAQGWPLLSVEPSNWRRRLDRRFQPRKIDRMTINFIRANGCVCEDNRLVDVGQRVELSPVGKGQVQYIRARFEASEMNEVMTREWDRRARCGWPDQGVEALVA
ncbi:hypothetical protein JAAARDRAFT_431742 [Jaapia argillacea MUCL 33604]|uniref:Uncharacterized protein n=1 Tax=Jaapia argillacea MUCL 33604 TaxID=933084 RepID=A0A067PSI6_9AGAM|nr:hypothetical protein JAAARDRAFT_431742 [Jaapia argillacea MUCL 33604]